MNRERRPCGFTLIELMIVVSIIGILASIAIPKFVQVVRKSNEGATKGNLGTLRSAVTIYYSDMEGQYPGDLSGLTAAGKYLQSIPKNKVKDYHMDSDVVLNAIAPDDSTGWAYDNVAADANYGTVWINCTHTDTKGTVWTAY